MTDNDIKAIMEQYDLTGNRIRRMRKERKLSLTQVECLTRISTARLSLIERNQMKGIYVYELMLIAKALEVDADILMGYDAEDNAGKEILSLKERAHRQRLLAFDEEEYRKLMK